MEPEAIGQLFDQLLASSASRVATETKKPSSRACPMPLMKEPRRAALPEKHREIAAVDEILKATFRKLVTGNADWPLFLHGPPGTGKTCAALALADFLFPSHSRFTTIGDLVQQVMDTWKTETKFVWKPYEPFSKSGGSWLVVLDELGTRANVTDTHYETIQKVIDIREGSPLILISNKDIKGIGEIYDARIASRCESGTVVNLTGRDRRTS